MSAPVAIAPAPARTVEAPHAAPRLLLFTRDDPARVTGGVETFAARLLEVFPGSEVVAYSGAAGARRVLNEARDARAAGPALLDAVARSRPAAVVANGAAAWALPELPVPLVTVYHGTYAGFGRAIAPVARWRGALARSYGAWMERRAARHASAVVAVSSSVAEQARRHYGVRHRLVVIENGGPRREAPRATREQARAQLQLGGEPLLLFVGRGDATKGFDVVLELARRRPQWRFAAAGAAPAAGLPRNVAALGVVAPAALATWRAAADAIVLPTCYEGCSYALIEALAADRPIVTTATGAFARPGRASWGFAVPPSARVRDAAFVDRFESAIAQVLAGPHAFAPRAATHARFAFERFARDWRELIDAVTRHGR